MSRSSLRLLATSLLAGFGVLLAGLTASAAGPAGPDDAWTPTGALPDRLDSPVFALAVNPGDGRQVLAGAASGAGGAVYRSADGGVTWRPLRTGLGRAVAAIAFDPRQPGAVLAGTRGAGIWRSGDGGLTWQAQAGTEGRTIRAFAFAGDVALAAGDPGVLASRAGGPWTAAGLAQVRVGALAVLPADAGSVVVAGGDGSQSADPLPLYASADAGQSWAPVPGAAGVAGGSTVVSALAVQRGADGARLLMGTNGGVFASSDRGQSWQPLTGSGALPVTDVSGLAVSPRHPERLYVASDGGGSDQGGLWSTADGGQHFGSLAPPLPEVTAVAATADDPTGLVVATFRPGDHLVSIWTYRDAGGQPHGTMPPPETAAGPPAAERAPSPTGRPAWLALLLMPEAPYLALGASALVVVAAALVANVRGGRPR